jgi:hypothetical protein
LVVSGQRSAGIGTGQTTRFSSSRWCWWSAVSDQQELDGIWTIIIGHSSVQVARITAELFADKLTADR